MQQADTWDLYHDIPKTYSTILKFQRFRDWKNVEGFALLTKQIRYTILWDVSDKNYYQISTPTLRCIHYLTTLHIPVVDADT